jgi:N-carbamoylputrescine amidase
MSFQLGCAQFAPEKAAVDKNLDRIAEIVFQSQTESIDLLLLPEASTSGYFLEGGVLEASLSANQLVEKLSERLRKEITHPVDVCLGFYQREDGNLYNSAAYIELNPEGVRLVGVYQKFFLPTYGVFDEERFVTRGRDLCILETRFGRLSMLICEDVWHGVMPTLCAVSGAQVILVPAASPARGFAGQNIENHDRYRRLFRAISEEHGLYCANCQLCGFEGGKGFIGGSMVIDPMGRVVAEAPIADEAMIVAEVDLELVWIARAQSPLISDLQSVWEEVRRLFANTRF